MPEEAIPSDPIPSPMSRELAGVTCSYNLRGGAADGVCPECGTPIEQSLHGDDLRYADPAWLARVRLGMCLEMLHLGMAYMVGPLLIPVSGTVLPSPIKAYIWIPLIYGPYCALIIIAAWLITSLEPRFRNWPELQRPHRLVRICMTTYCPIFLVCLVVPGLNAPTRFSISWQLFYALSLVLYVVGLAGLYIILRRLALRAGQTKLASHTRVIMIA